MKPKNIDELEKILKDHGYTTDFRSCKYLDYMFKYWPIDKVILHVDDAKKEKDKGTCLHFLSDRGVKPMTYFTIKPENWPVFRDVSAEQLKEKQQQTENERQFNFFFPGMKMSDPNKLPPPPRILGRSWDSIADD